ncbi:MAG: hypothetical protein AVDCRST_MAG19-1387 [uncultured Thermomicrobiales bacterium]|uniref:Uncharacterized protein n=1 Tax=uncultured Thermomicrobiales bacterium TaxID=1645740 RepID=A0A6J4UTL2_9BACT|nr:MAG: hypothetical protein AVDCRST_MAG19-1387 [uncultured Thermomicrobiales bacterium]
MQDRCPGAVGEGLERGEDDGCTNGHADKEGARHAAAAPSSGMPDRDVDAHRVPPWYRVVVPIETMLPSITNDRSRTGSD